MALTFRAEREAELQRNALGKGPPDNDQSTRPCQLPISSTVTTRYFSSPFYSITDTERRWAGYSAYATAYAQ
eukprot:2372348-Pyramimonas_sp.AAC.1